MALRALVGREPAARDVEASRDDPLPVHSADAAHLRVGEDGGRYRPVLGADVAADDVRGRHTSLVLPEVREEADTGGVTDRPDAVGGAQAVVDGDASLRDLHPELLEADPGDVRPAARCDEEALGVERVA